MDSGLQKWAISEKGWNEHLTWALSRDIHPLQARITVCQQQGESRCTRCCWRCRGAGGVVSCRGKASELLGVCPGLEYLGDLRVFLVCPGGGSCPWTERRMSQWSLTITCFLLRRRRSGLVFNVCSESCSEKEKNGCRINRQIYRLRPPVRSLNLATTIVNFCKDGVFIRRNKWALRSEHAAEMHRRSSPWEGEGASGLALQGPSRRGSSLQEHCVLRKGAQSGSCILHALGQCYFQGWFDDLPVWGRNATIPSGHLAHQNRVAEVGFSKRTKPKPSEFPSSFHCWFHHGSIHFHLCSFFFF